MPLTITSPGRLDRDQITDVRALIDSIVGEDGRDPLSDQALTHVTAESVEHVLTYDDDQLRGYAQLDGDSLEIAATPAAIGPLLDTFAGRSLLVWTHGHRSRLVAPLEARGFTRTRELHQLRRDLDAPIDVPPTPDAVQIRPFTVGRDEDAQLRVNAAAFAHHPEQGGWTRADLDAREAEDWFDPAGFLLAWRGAELLGFHWTKVHPDNVGEVYVIGVDPSAQGLGLGVVLLQRGLAYLQQRGCPQVLLYVDGDNIGAMRLYERTGFHRHDLDEQWRSPDTQLSSTGSVSNT